MKFKSAFLRLSIAFIVILVLMAAAAGVFFYRMTHGPVPVGVCTAPPSGEGWINLLDAEHTGGWKNTTDDKDIFEIKDGALHIFGKSLTTLRYAGYAAERFSDFDLHLEFKVTPRANSGVFLRSQPNDPVYRGFEVQVLEDFGKPPNKNSCGSIYDVTTPMYNMSLPPGEWNSYDISVKGKEVIVRMNDWMVIHTDLSKMTTTLGKFKVPYAELPMEGNLLLQDHGGEAWYRNIFIKKS